MKSSRDPVRWSELGSDAPPELAAGIRALRAGRGSEAQVAALGRRLAPELAAPTAAGAAGATSLWLKLGGGLLLAGAIGLYALTRAEVPQPRAARSVPAARAALPVAAEPPARALPAASAASPEPEQAGLRSAVRSASKPRPAHASSAPVPAAGSTTETELALLQRAQSAIDRDPGAALVAAEEHAHQHPTGVFSQEREVLAMEALVKLRRVPAALARAERFVRAYPASPHNERVRALLERFRMLAPATIQGDRIHPLDVPEATREP